MEHILGPPKERRPQTKGSRLNTEAGARLDRSEVKEQVKEKQGGSKKKRKETAEPSARGRKKAKK